MHNFCILSYFNKNNMQNRIYNKVTLPNNQTIHYQQANPDSTKPQVIFLVHGNMSAYSWWNDIIDRIVTQGHRIVAIDQRGFGQSTLHTPCNKLQSWASDIIEFCKLLKINKIILNGWSFGGAVSQKVAEMEPQLVHKLILTCSVSHEGFKMKMENGQLVKTREEIAKFPTVVPTLQILKEQNKQMMRKVFDMILYSKMGSYPEEKKRQLALTPLKQRNYLDVLQAIVNNDININKIKVKTLVIHGNEDLVLPAQTIFKTAEKLGKLELWENGAHMIPLQDTDRYVKTIIKFIRQ